MILKKKHRQEAGGNPAQVRYCESQILDAFWGSE